MEFDQILHMTYVVLVSLSGARQRDVTNVSHKKSKVLLHDVTIWAASNEFGTYRLCEQRRFRRACASAQSRQNLRCSLIQAVSQEEPSDRKPDPWPL